jgi:hypothetical protein
MVVLVVSWRKIWFVIVDVVVDDVVVVPLHIVRLPSLDAKPYVWFVSMRRMTMTMMMMTILTILPDYGGGGGGSPHIPSTNNMHLNLPHIDSPLDVNAVYIGTRFVVPFGTIRLLSRVETMVVIKYEKTSLSMMSWTTMEDVIVMAVDVDVSVAVVVAVIVEYVDNEDSTATKTKTSLLLV